MLINIAGHSSDECILHNVTLCNVTQERGAVDRENGGNAKGEGRPAHTPGECLCVCGTRNKQWLFGLSTRSRAKDHGLCLAEFTGFRNGLTPG